MATEEKKGTSEPKSRYVWDPQKLAWVEIVQETADEVQSAQDEPAAVRASVVTQEQSVETGIAEAPIESVYAEYMGALIRLAAFIIDLVILVVVLFGVSRIANIPSYSGVVLGFIYFVGLWMWRGQTVGKMIVGVKIVGRDGSRITPLQAILRYLFYIVPSYAPILFAVESIPPIRPYAWVIVFVASFVNLLIIALTPEKRAIQDLMAGTVVIRTRRPFSRTPEGAENTVVSDSEVDAGA
jgi:uncharacterized RDD family membrane protein YckC